MVSRRRQSLPLRGMVNRLEVSFFSLIGQARPPGWLLAWVAGLCTLLHASAATLVVPPDSRAFDAGAASGAGDLVHPVHIQTVYPSRMFDGASVLLISELRYRPSSFYGTAFDSILTGVQIRLSTGIGPGEPPLAIFASNRGVDDTLVYDGDAALASAFESGPGNTKNFDIRFPLQTPFLYRPALGSLVVEFSHPAAGATSPIDVVGVTDGGGRVFSVDPSASSGNSDTGCDVLELVYSTPEEPPSWVSLPTSQRVPAGTNLVWSAIVSGSPPLAFQWFFQGQLLNGATSSVLRLPNVSRQQAGEYWLTVTNPHGGLTSSVVQLEVVEFPRVPVVVEPLGPSSRRTALVLSEIMYHPPDDGSGLNLEFIEVHNSGDVPVKLDGYRLSGAVDFTFPEGTTLEPHAFEVIAGNSTALQSRYPAVKPVGDFIGSLPNDSGTIRLRNRSGAVLLEVEYEDDLPWPVAADGGGHSLFLARPSYGEGEAAAWSPSPTVGGSPGQPEIVLSDLSERVFFNEILLGPTGTQDGFVELGSQSERSVDLSGWILTDDASTPKLRLPAGTVLPATGFLAIPHAQLGFGLKVEGGRLLLLKPEGDRVVDALRYRFLRPGIAWGRQPDGHTLLGELAVPSPGRPNAGQLPASVVINEILYRSLSGDPDDQFLEVYNRSETTVDLTGGRVTGDVNFSFPDQTKLPPREYLVLARNRTRLLSRYPTLNPAVVYGDFGGRMKPGKPIRLTLPYEAKVQSGNATATNRIAVVANELTFRAGGSWGKWADGGGASLELIDPDSDNRLGVNWADSDPPAHAVWTTLSYTGPHEFGDGNSPANAFEVSLLGEGECFVDQVEVRDRGGANLMVNGDFDTSSSGWSFQGNHELSELATTGGVDGTRGVLLRAAGRGDYLGNRLVADLRSAMRRDLPGTLSLKVRWRRGWPELLGRIRGGTLEVTGPLEVPSDLGTPGRANSRRVPHAGPAITDVLHSPVLPAPNEPILVTARVIDSASITSVVCHYRSGSSTTLRQRALNDDGMEGDRIPGDGVFSVQLPGAGGGELLGFRISASDARGVTRQFPSSGLAEECLIRVGEFEPPGTFGTYRLWVSATNLARWSQRSNSQINNRPLSLTFVYNRSRVIYGAGGTYNGSDNTSELYDRPTGNLCGYSLDFPEDDRFLGSTTAVLDWPTRDPTAQREQFTYWMANEVGLPYNHRRYVRLHVNGVRESQRAPLFGGSEPLIFEDLQVPGGDYLNEWHPDHDRGDLFKIHVWRRDYKFPARPAPFGESFHATLTPYLNSRGEKHLARYRWNWRKRAVHGSANDYATLFELIDAGQLADPTAYVRRLEELVDTEQWMHTLAFERCIGNFDSYGNRNAQNVYAYKPDGGGRWELHTFDNDLVLGSTSEDPSADLFGIYPSAPDSSVGIPDPFLAKMRGTPALLRAYWRGFRAFVDGPMVRSNHQALVQARHASLTANGVSVAGEGGVAGPDQFTSWVDARRAFILAQLDRLPSGFGVNVPAAPVATNLLTLTGRAPIQVRWLALNGVVREVRWVALDQWSLLLPLVKGTNALELVGLGGGGTPLSGMVRRFEVVSTADAPSVDPQHPPVLITEWMADNERTILDPDFGTPADWFELHNPGTNALDLSGWWLSDDPITPMKYRIPDGVRLEAGGYGVVWADALGVFTNGHLHAGFRLSKSGDEIVLSDASGVRVDKVSFGPQRQDTSQGRMRNLPAADFLFFGAPSPGGANRPDPPAEFQVIRGGGVNGSPVRLSWLTSVGLSYRLQFKRELVEDSWRDLDPLVVGTGTTVEFHEPQRSGEARRFYRVLVQP